MTDDPFWKNPRKIPNVLKLDESMKFSPYQNLISAAIILKKASETLSNGGSNDRVKHFYGWSYLASIPAFLGMDAGWNTTTSLHTYHRNGQESPTSDFRGSEFKVDRCNVLPCLNTSCCCLQAFPCWMWTLLQNLFGISRKDGKKCSIHGIRYTVYTWSHVLCM